jgi:HPt (histidine-containing phosphotransfer) domain-containing protein
VFALAGIPCLVLAALLWRLAVSRALSAGQARDACSLPSESVPSAASRHGDVGIRQKTVAAAPLQPPDWDNEDARQAYLEACRVFLRDQHDCAARLYRLAAREDWEKLHETARALREAAHALNAGHLAAASLSLQEAALADTASAARCVEQCVPALDQVFNAVEQLLRGHAETAREKHSAAPTAARHTSE